MEVKITVEATIRTDKSGEYCSVTCDHLQYLPHGEFCVLNNCGVDVDNTGCYVRPAACREKTKTTETEQCQ